MQSYVGGRYDGKNENIWVRNIGGYWHMGGESWKIDVNGKATCFRVAR